MATTTGVETPEAYCQYVEDGATPGGVVR